MTTDVFAKACQWLVTMTCLVLSACLLLVVFRVFVFSEWLIYEIFGIYGQPCLQIIRLICQILLCDVWLLSDTSFILPRIKSDTKDAVSYCLLLVWLLLVTISMTSLWARGRNANTYNISFRARVKNESLLQKKKRKKINIFFKKKGEIQILSCVSPQIASLFHKEFHSLTTVLMYVKSLFTLFLKILNVRKKFECKNFKAKQNQSIIEKEIFRHYKNDYSNAILSYHPFNLDNLILPWSTRH